MNNNKRQRIKPDWPAVYPTNGRENSIPKDRKPHPGSGRKGRLRSDPHKNEGSGSQVGSSEAEEETQSSHPTPRRDNKGGDSATPESFVGWEFSPVSELKTPKEYFYHLALDLLQVSVWGDWLDGESFLAFEDRRDSAKWKWQSSKTRTLVKTPDGRELAFLPHGARGGYRALLRGGDPLEIRALGQRNRAPFSFRFGARWCLEQTVEEIEVWIMAFLGSIGYVPEEINLSEVHVRCDVPRPFYQADISRRRGAGTRNSNVKAHFGKNGFSGISNVGMKKGFKYSIYDKRLQQEQKKASLLWPAIWNHYQIPENVPIWRVEGRWKLKQLRRLGLLSISHLTPGAVENLWHDFTTRYLVFSGDTDKRLSRCKPTRAWAKIQSCGKHHDTSPIEVKVDGSTSKLAQVAVGVIARLVREMGISADEEILHELMRDILIAGLKVEPGNLFEDETELRRLVKQAFERRPDLSRGLGEDVERALVSQIAYQVKTRPSARPYTTEKARSADGLGADHV